MATSIGDGTSLLFDQSAPWCVWSISFLVAAWTSGETFNSITTPADTGTFEVEFVARLMAPREILLSGRNKVQPH